MTVLPPPGIAAIASYLPAKRVDNSYLEANFGFDPKFLSGKVGFTSRAVAADDEAVSDMAVAAAEALFKQTGIDRASIGAIVLVTQNPDYRLPTTANLIQDRLKLRRDIPAFDINQGCSGYVIGLATLQGLMIAQGIEHALLLTGDAYTKVLNQGDRSTQPLFGDGATATLLSAGQGGKIGRFAFGSDGSGGNELIVRAGGSRNPHQPVEGEGALYMNGRAIFTFALRTVPENLRQCLAANGRKVEDVDVFVLHQASAYIVGAIAQAMNIPESKAPWLLGDVGNTVSSTIPMALDRLGGPSGLKGRSVALCGFGVGLSWASTLVDF